MEVQLHESFSLVVNHRHCIASYRVGDVKNASVNECNFHQLNRQRRLYWNFLWRFPSHIERCPERAVKDASDALTWFYTDNLISGRASTVPFSKEECDELRSLLQELIPQQSVAKVHFLAWLLREVCSFRNAEDYGLHTEKDLRRIKQERKQPDLSTSDPTVMLPTIFPMFSCLITILFFGIPRSYLIHIKRSFEYRGRLNNMQQTWEAYITRLTREYSHFLLISTVLLSATVSFLAVPNVSRGSQMASIISVFSSLGSIVLGVFSIWRHQGSTKRTDSYAYMRNARHGWLGIYGHAMLLSLPAALLVWSIIAFMVSIMVYTVSDVASDSPLVRASSWISLALFLIIIVAVGFAVHSLSLMWTYQPTDFGLRARLHWFFRRVIPLSRSTASLV
ncbi:hypothetical protein BDZ89DRAFT_1055656 [Hymenopellis radicata]|nr:hypothetical protein BDZ89DRAFT_1055656 [Hymenopellis radicata]